MEFADQLAAEATAVANKPSHIAGAIGVELQQAAILSRRRRRTLLDQPRANARLDGTAVNFTDGYDGGQAQTFPVRPMMRDLVTGEQVALDALPYLPGPKPPAGWDGEVDASSPIAEGG